MALPAVARAPGAGDHGSARGEEWAAAGNDVFTINPAEEFTADQIIQGTSNSSNAHMRKG